MPSPFILAVVLVSYLIGAIPFGFLIVRWLRGIDIRQHGSGNIGATNVGRVLGWPFFTLVFLLDFAKGAGPVLAARWLMGYYATSAEGDSLPVVLAGLAALIGHMWPVYLRFRGGKGVATGAGVIVMLAPWPSLFAVATWLVVMIGTRYVSLSSIAAGIALALARLAQVWREGFVSNGDWALTGFCLVAPLLVIVRHRANIVRLWAGTEPRVGQKKNRQAVSV